MYSVPHLNHMVAGGCLIPVHLWISNTDASIFWRLSAINTAGFPTNSSNPVSFFVRQYCSSSPDDTIFAHLFMDWVCLNTLGSFASLSLKWYCFELRTYFMLVFCLSFGFLEPFYTEDGEVLVLLEANPQTGQEDVVALFVHSGNNTKLVFSVVSGTLSLKFVTKGNIAENSVGLLG